MRLRFLAQGNNESLWRVSNRRLPTAPCRPWTFLATQKKHSMSINCFQQSITNPGLQLLLSVLFEQMTILLLLHVNSHNAFQKVLKRSDWLTKQLSNLEHWWVFLTVFEVRWQFLYFSDHISLSIFLYSRANRSQPFWTVL